MSRDWLQGLISSDGSDAAKAVERLSSGKPGYLITLIDQLLPMLAMESNLRFGSFHAIKMALYVRDVGRRGLFTRASEQAVAELLIREARHRLFAPFEAGPLPGHSAAPKNTWADFHGCLRDGNVHNGYYYASHALAEDPQRLAQQLAQIGARYLADSLGHSLSCFLPAMAWILRPMQPAAYNVLLSYLMYLGRWRPEPPAADETVSDQVDVKTWLPRAAAGDGIVNLHHMITLHSFWLWQREFGPRFGVPFFRYQRWVEDKKPDPAVERYVDNLRSVPSAGTYEEFRQQFMNDREEGACEAVFSLLEADTSTAYDWLFRVYASLYNEETWNPHFYTSLYAALELYTKAEGATAAARRLAVYQAVRYIRQELELG